MPPPLLDSYLGFAFRGQPAVWPILERQGLSLARAQEAWDTRHQAFGPDLHDWTPAKAIALFGAPTVSTDTALAWDLALWPDHRFWGMVRQDANLFFSDAIRLRDPIDIASLPNAELETVQTALRLGWHCAEEVKSLLGPPLAEDGWSPECAMYYGPLTDGTYLEITTQYGLTSSLRTVRSSVWLPPRPTPWWKRAWRALAGRAV